MLIKSIGLHIYEVTTLRLTPHAQLHSLSPICLPNTSEYVCCLLLPAVNMPSRYRTSNLLNTSVLPGPKEQTADEIQRYLRPIISDLLRLYKEGILVYSPEYPNGASNHHYPHLLLI